jgi:hypothetical protein
MSISLPAPPADQEPRLPASYQLALQRFVETLKRVLGDQLDSLVLYGSAVGGEVIEGQSDLNFLVILRESTPELHASIARAAHGQIPITPLVFGRWDLDASFRAFAMHILTIRHLYQVLHGEDPLAGFSLTPEAWRRVAEQSLRYQRHRIVHAFTEYSDDRERYRRFLLHVAPRVFTPLGDLLRLSGHEVPEPFAERLALLQEVLGPEAIVLRDLLDLKESRIALTAVTVRDLHGRLHRFLDQALVWVDRQPHPASPASASPAAQPAGAAAP